MHPSTDATARCRWRHLSASNAFSTTYGTGYSHVWIGLAAMITLMHQARDVPSRVVRLDYGPAYRGERCASAAGHGPFRSWQQGIASPSRRLVRVRRRILSQRCLGLDGLDGPAGDFVSSGSACGGGDASWSSGAYHVDNIHLNNRGYCKTWTMPAVQSALSCGAASYDCDGVNPSARRRSRWRCKRGEWRHRQQRRR